MPQHLRLPYADTGAFSSLVTQYLQGSSSLRSFYKFNTDKDGISAAIEARSASSINREVLVSTLREQYAQLPEESAVQNNIERLKETTTFTVCTAHQPNLCTGYLYFVYKILHAVKLANDLNKDFPKYHFVPVYYMGSEDADLDELGTFRYEDKKFVWDAAGQTGAVGQMKTASLKPLLDELFKLLGPPGENLDYLKELLSTAYLQHDNVSDATQYLVHSLFGKYGLVVLNPDARELKQTFIPVMQDDLLNHRAEGLAQQSGTDLTNAGFKAQAFPRSINLFYLKDNIRERIEQVSDDNWQVINTSISFSKEALLQELHQYPERFSPNVILRPLYQETILPDVAFIGGGAEVAYWLQLGTVFAHYNVLLPAIILRQSFLWINSPERQLKEKLGLDLTDIFKDQQQLIAKLVTSDAGEQLSTTTERSQMLAIWEGMKQKATAIDPTLEKSAEAAVARMDHQLAAMEKKMLRAEKRKHQTEIDRITRLKQKLFPNNGLQERVENFMPYYLQHGPSFFDTLLQAIDSYDQKFVVIMC